MRRLLKTVLLLTVAVLTPACIVAPVEHAGPPAVGVELGVHVPVYPQLVAIPGYPVYYAPGLSLNFFFYDGIYWVFHGNGWYFSYWYDGPWHVVQPAWVPGVILHVPLRYYRNPPRHFHAWPQDGPPHWDEHWGHGWDKNRHDDWKKVPERKSQAPLPHFQRDYAGKGYPKQIERQEELNRQHYHYQPQDPSVKRFAVPGNRKSGGRDDKHR